MTTGKKFKQRVRERMAQTGESYTAARRALDERAEQEDICPECRHDASVPHEIGCSRGAFPIVGRGSDLHDEHRDARPCHRCGAHELFAVIDGTAWTHDLCAACGASWWNDPPRDASEAP